MCIRERVTSTFYVARGDRLFPDREFSSSGILKGVEINNRGREYCREIALATVSSDMFLSETRAI